MEIFVRPELTIRMSIENPTKKETVIHFHKTTLKECVSNIRELFEMNKSKELEKKNILRFREFQNSKGGEMQSIAIYGLEIEQITSKIERFYLM